MLIVVSSLLTELHRLERWIKTHTDHELASGKLRRWKMGAIEKLPKSSPDEAKLLQEKQWLNITPCCDIADPIRRFSVLSQRSS